MDQWSEDVARMRASTDQLVAGLTPLIENVAAYHAACIAAGLPPTMADALTLRVLPLFHPLDFEGLT